jgi:hypothetical protein
VLGSRWEVPDYEVEYCQLIADFITRAASSLGYNGLNWYGASTTVDNIYSAAAGNGDTWAFTFYVGHGDYVYRDEVGHDIYYIHDDSGIRVYDDGIYDYSTPRSVRLSFIWSCYQGREIGGASGDWYYGMPQAWLHTTQLSTDGYVNPNGRGYVFLGWRTPAPFLSLDCAGSTDTGYLFLQYFYSMLFEYYIDQRGDVIQSLDYASQQIWGVPFSQSPFYQGFTYAGIFMQMVVYGDGGLWA